MITMIYYILSDNFQLVQWRQFFLFWEKRETIRKWYMCYSNWFYFSFIFKCISIQSIMKLEHLIYFDFWQVTRLQKVQIVTESFSSSDNTISFLFPNQLSIYIFKWQSKWKVKMMSSSIQDRLGTKNKLNSSTK